MSNFHSIFLAFLTNAIACVQAYESLRGSRLLVLLDKTNVTLVPCHPYELKWDELTTDQKDAARGLSFNKLRWDDDTGLPDPVEIRNDFWKDAPSGETELSARELENAMLLGYSEGSWEGHYEDYDWEELPKGKPERSDDKNVQDAAAILGYNSSLWDDNVTSSATEDTAWVNLTETEKEAAGIFGYDECLWDRDDYDDDNK